MHPLVIFISGIAVGLIPMTIATGYYSPAESFLIGIIVILTILSAIGVIKYPRNSKI